MHVDQFTRLIIARRMARLTQAELADAMGVTRGFLSQVEAGVTHLPANRFTEMARLLNVAEAFLKSPESVGPPLDLARCNFRSLLKTPQKERDQALGLGDILRLTVMLVEAHDPGAFAPVNVPAAAHGWADALAEVAVGDEQDNSVLDGLDPETEAARLRRRWGLSERGPIDNMVGLLEDHGVVVHTLPRFSSETIDAFGFWQDKRPVVLLNQQKKDPFRSRFDAAHELGHHVMHRGLVRGREGTGRIARGADGRMEDQANAFAAAFLVPSIDWINEAPRTTSPYAYIKAKLRWKVSAAALIVRSHALGILNAKQYQSAMVQYSRLGWRNGEPRLNDIEYEMPARLATALAATPKALEAIPARYLEECELLRRQPPRGAVVPLETTLLRKLEEDASKLDWRVHYNPEALPLERVPALAEPDNVVQLPRRAQG